MRVEPVGSEVLRHIPWEMYIGWLIYDSGAGRDGINIKI